MAKVNFKAEELFKCAESFESMTLDSKKLLAGIVRKQLEFEQDKKIRDILKRYLDKWNPEHLKILATTFKDSGSKTAVWFIKYCEKDFVSDLKNCTDLKIFNSGIFLIENIVKYVPRLIFDCEQIFEFLVTDQHKDFVDQTILKNLLFNSILSCGLSMGDVQQLDRALIRIGKTPDVWKMPLFLAASRKVLSTSSWQGGHKVWFDLRNIYLRQSSKESLEIGITINEMYKEYPSMIEREVCFDDMKYLSGPIVHEDIERLYESYLNWFDKYNFKVVINSDLFQGYQNSVNSIDPLARKTFLQILKKIGIEKF